MSYRSHNKRDANQAEIVEALRARGAVVVEIEHPTDLLVGYRERWVLAEVKSSPKARIRPSQKDFVERVNAQCLPAVFLFSLHDVECFFPSKYASGDQPASGSSAQSGQDNNPVGG